ncbi:hypothetical protein SteCoe_18997 [Stentor coeruleus]|uniref:dual-specificity kinase n=1 Tax=Stentor coeruleus TaxID=5963 RepID=A0A1R2BV46_9CILI|nr:hypothetical protein SteCoe_18997 [Stentor coeruleus]
MIMNFKSPKNSKSVHKLSSRSGKVLSTKPVLTLSRPILKNPLLHLDPRNKITSKKKSIQRKRNHSLEGNYEENQHDKPSKRNNSLIEPKNTEEIWDPNKTPYPPALIVRLFSKHLTYYEQSEILNYKNIFYIALGINKLEANPTEPNNGFDDQRNDLVLIKNDHIQYRYEILDILGKGSYGQVIKAYDHKEKKLIALKIIRNLQCIISQAKIEIQILYKLAIADSGSRYVVKIIEHFIFRNHICITFDLLDINLYQYLRSKTNPLSLSAIKNIIEQILFGMRFYHSLGILHCDLKPENIMLTETKVDVKIIDFGSGCFNKRKIFTYIQSRYYRAPEVILQIGYDEKIDIWSLGCIVAELIMGKPLFIGKDEIDQFLSFVEILGMPPAYMVEKSGIKDSIMRNMKKNTLVGKGRVPGSKPLKSVIPISDAGVLDFIGSNLYLECLAWDPNDRMSAEGALKHEFFNKNSFMQHTNSLPLIRLERLVLSGSVNKKKNNEQENKIKTKLLLC